MGYLNELLSRNPLVIDGGTIRPHHNYTDDLYTGGNHKITNYDRIKSMSVEDLTELINGITKVAAVKLGKDFVVNDKQFIQQWLLQEVDEDDTKRKES